MAAKLGPRSALLAGVWRYSGVAFTLSLIHICLVIELHIKVTFGLNIAAIVRSITHKVKYAVEDATGLKVQRIDVCVDDIV